MSPGDLDGLSFVVSPFANRSGMMRYTTSFGPNPWKRPAGGRAGAPVNGAAPRPPDVRSVSGYEPGAVPAGIVTSMNAYVPAELTLGVLHVRRPHDTRVPARFLPRTSTRTGLIECPAHQFGGSTFSTLGAWPGSAVVAARARPNSNELLR